MPGGDYEQLMDSLLNKVITLGEDYKVYPGHGPATTISEEIASNCFLDMNRIKEFIMRLKLALLIPYWFLHLRQVIVLQRPRMEMLFRLSRLLRYPYPKTIICRGGCAS